MQNSIFIAQERSQRLGLKYIYIPYVKRIYFFILVYTVWRIEIAHFSVHILLLHHYKPIYGLCEISTNSRDALVGTGGACFALDQHPTRSTCLVLGHLCIRRSTLSSVSAKKGN